MKKNIFKLIIGVCIILPSTVEASNNKTIFGIAAATIAGIAILANGDNSQQAKQNHGYKKQTYQKRKKVVVTDNMKVQIALKNLDFYKGKITGNLNSFKTKKAIKQMNLSYNISDASSLKPEHKMSLILLSELFDLEKHLNVQKETKKFKNKRFQASLAVYGVYTGKIDGICGKQTRIAVSKYKGENNLDSTTKLTDDEKFDLMSSAIDINEKKIFEQIHSMKVDNIKQKQSTEDNIGINKDVTTAIVTVEKSKSWKAKFNESNNTIGQEVLDIKNDINATNPELIVDKIDVENNKTLIIVENIDSIEKVSTKPPFVEANNTQGTEVLQVKSKKTKVEAIEEVSWKEAYKI